jgi:iron complex outermembrane receptor protein
MPDVAIGRQGEPVRRNPITNTFIRGFRVMGKRINSDRLAYSISRVLNGRPQAGMLATAMLLMGTQALPAMADEGPSDDAKTLDAITVISTGTRKANMAVTDSPAPIQLISPEKLSSTAAPDLQNAIANQVPSYNVNQVGGDMGSQTLTASLRGLSPNHTLILVNGKRLHNTANVNASDGSAAPDLSFIPEAAIDHVEVLTDGAAALYGSDAIAGVINIILKKNHDGGEVNTGYSGYQDGGGADFKWGANIGFGDSSNFFNLSVEAENRQSVYRFVPTAMANCLSNETNCAAVNPDAYSYFSRIDPNRTSQYNSKYPYLNNWLNPPEVRRKALYFNSGAVLSDNVSFYAFGGYGKKTAESEENYRGPAQLMSYTDSSGTAQYMYPYGFNPSEYSDEKDYTLTAGLTGMLGDWTWDASSTYGKDKMDVYTLNSMNQNLWNEYGYSPTDFYDGTFTASQWTTNLNATRDFDIGLAAPLTFNVGVEYRQDKYGISPGDYASYYKTGASSFPGYNPDTNTGNYSRNSYSIFADAVLYPVEKWLVDGAVRHEHYSDFGSKTIGKLTTRFDFTDSFAMRATVSTGFRAPTLGEGYYSAVNVSPSGAYPQLQPNGAAAAALGFGTLKPETSTNFSLGFVFNPLPNLSSTLDFYQIKIKDRITRAYFCYVSGGEACDPVSGAETDSYNTALGQALVDAGYLGGIDPSTSGGTLDTSARQNIGVYLFNNGLDTKTQGVDWVTNYLTEFGWGSVDWTLAANYGTLDVTGVKSAPESLGGGSMYSTATILNMESANPKYRINIGATINIGKFSINVTEAIYGPQHRWQAANTNDEGFGTAFPDEVLAQLTTKVMDGVTYYKQEIGVLPTTNLSISFKPNDKWTLTVGGDNIFNKYPDKYPAAVWNWVTSHYENQWGYLSKYETFSPIGYFGGRWYAKATYRF